MDGKIDGLSGALGYTPHLNKRNRVLMKLNHAIKLGFVEESVNKCLQVALVFGFDLQ